MAKRKLLTSGQLADELGISPQTVARYARKEWLTPAEVTVGGHLRWELDDVRRQMDALRKRDQ